ncbi:MAG: hypothetical protein EA428_02825 [Spirochaetaceae bacterium]|nr:MAG: hypothetical protein EA428_02825 [Spirochaetaceae bacterium]
MIWGQHSFPDDTLFRLAFGNLRVYLGRRRREWRWSLEYSDLTEAASFEAVGAAEAMTLSNLSWQRMITKELSEVVVLAPRLPDRPLSIFPQEQVQIAQNAQVQLWISIPLWVHVGCAKGETVFEAGSERLSGSWLGDSVGGRMAYTLKSEPRYHGESDLIPDHRARCVLSILNQADAPFVVSKLAVPSELLHLYQTTGGYGGGVYTSEVKLLQTRDHEISVNPLHHRESSRQPPFVAARVRGVDNFWKRSVGLLKRIGNYS